MSEPRVAVAGIPVSTPDGTFTIGRDEFPEFEEMRRRGVHIQSERVRIAHPSADYVEAGLAALREACVQLGIPEAYITFVETVERGASYDDTVEQIDIGGPAMVRASAKNHANVAIVVEPARYPAIIAAVQAGGTDLAQRRSLALAAFSHTADYDAAVLADLTTLHAGFTDLLTRLTGLAPRLAHYPRRFDAALAKIAAGDHSWFARPIADSYHTVWFELHEDLIGVTGRSRADEAAAGRAL